LEKTDNCSCIVCIYAIHGEISRSRSSEEVPVMGMERRAEESKSLNQTRLIGREQYSETSGRCNCGNHPLVGNQLTKWILCEPKLTGCKPKLAVKRRKRMTEELLMEAMFNWLNRQEALAAVKRNKGAAGIRLHGQIFAPCKICIPHIPVGYAGGRVMQEQLPR